MLPSESWRASSRILGWVFLFRDLEGSPELRGTPSFEAIATWPDGDYIRFPCSCGEARPQSVQGRRPQAAGLLLEKTFGSSHHRSSSSSRSSRRRRRNSRSRSSTTSHGFTPHSRAFSSGYGMCLEWLPNKIGAELNRRPAKEGMQGALLVGLT